MARGFSHSGSGGGGSRGGGGFSGGGGSRGGGGGFRMSSGGGPRRDRHDHYEPHHRPPRGPRHIHMFGRTVVVTTGFQGFFVVLLIIAISFCLAFFSMIGSIGDKKENVQEYKELIAKYEAYDKKFSDIITKAKNGETGYYLVTGEFSKTTYITYSDDPDTPGFYQAFRRGNQYWYFVVYEYQTPDGLKVDSTFTQYELADRNDFADIDNDGKLELEIAYTVIDGEYWAIDTGYKLSTNQDYLYDKDGLARAENIYSNTKKSIAVLGVIVAIIILVVVLVVVRKIKKSQKREEFEQAKQDAELAEAKAKAEVAEAEANKVGRTCSYCGCPIPDGEDNCPACGSRKFKK